MTFYLNSSGLLQSNSGIISNKRGYGMVLPIKGDSINVQNILNVAKKNLPNGSKIFVMNLVVNSREALHLNMLNQMTSFKLSLSSKQLDFLQWVNKEICDFSPVKVNMYCIVLCPEAENKVIEKDPVALFIKQIAPIILNTYENCEMVREGHPDFISIKTLLEKKFDVRSLIEGKLVKTIHFKHGTYLPHILKSKNLYKNKPFMMAAEIYEISQLDKEHHKKRFYYKALPVKLEKTDISLNIENGYSTQIYPDIIRSSFPLVDEMNNPISFSPFYGKNNSFLCLGQKQDLISSITQLVCSETSIGNLNWIIGKTGNHFLSNLINNLDAKQIILDMDAFDIDPAAFMLYCKKFGDHIDVLNPSVHDHVSILTYISYLQDLIELKYFALAMKKPSLITTLKYNMFNNYANMEHAGFVFSNIMERYVLEKHQFPSKMEDIILFINKLISIDYDNINQEQNNSEKEFKEKQLEVKHKPYMVWLNILELIKENSPITSIEQTFFNEINNINYVYYFTIDDSLLDKNAAFYSVGLISIFASYWNRRNTFYAKNQTKYKKLNLHLLHGYPSNNSHYCAIELITILEQLIKNSKKNHISVNMYLTYEAYLNYQKSEIEAIPVFKDTYKVFKPDSLFELGFGSKLLFIQTKETLGFIAPYFSAKEFDLISSLKSSVFNKDCILFQDHEMIPDQKVPYWKLRIIMTDDFYDKFEIKSWYPKS